MCQISLIVPVYNAEKSLRKCLDSIQGQVFGDFEVLLINDGSRDNSEAICTEYCNKDSRFRIINQENSGPSSARNRGIDESTAKYLAFVDSDDYIEPDMLEKLYTAAEEANADLTICGYYIENEHGSKKESVCKFDAGIYRGEECRKIAIETIDIGIAGNIRPYSCIRFVRRECMENPKMRFCTEIYRSEDYLLWTQVFFNIDCLCLMPDKYLYHYVENAGSITHKYVKDYWKMAKEIYEKLKLELPEEKEISQNLAFMFIRRTYMSLNIINKAKDKSTFKSDMREILKDKKLREVVDSIPFKKGVKVQKHRYLLLKFRLYFLIRLINCYRHRKFMK